MRKAFLAILCALTCLVAAANPIENLLERIDPGASSKFLIELKPSQKDFFELDQRGNRVVIRGNTWVNIASGLNWYLKYYAGIHLSWNGMSAKLPDTLPRVGKKERHETDLTLRYDLNYCTFSYSMAFWNWERWEKEIDWMALHGVNMPLAAVGEECIWRNLLLRLGYSEEEVSSFIAGPAFLAWWEMNNLEGWGGPNPKWWYDNQEALQKKILSRMKEYGMTPVLPGYSGMVPSNAGEKLGLNIATPKPWNGFSRPAFLQPTDPRFPEIAALYYEEMEKLYGKADYYSMDPFHEAKDDDAIDYAASGKAIMQAMKKFSPKAKWVVQGWSENPRSKMLDALEVGEIIVLDLFSECRPMWGMESLWKRDEGYGNHQWVFCMLENFGANVGLHGRMDQLLENFYRTKTDPMARQLCGIGFTMEGIENNPVMFELMSELPWREERFTKEEWIRDYCFARYGVRDETIEKAWTILAKSIYNCPRGNNQQGPHESIFCGRPSLDNFQVSSWSKMSNYYDPDDTREAARLMVSIADRYRGNNNFEYDLVDIVRQALSDQGRISYLRTIASFKSFSRSEFKKNRERFLEQLLAQDALLGTRREFRLGHWTCDARSLAPDPEGANWLEWNARVQITTWGNRYCANTGKLRDYAHKEWNGLLRDFYYPRWKTYLDMLEKVMEGSPMEDIDFYAMEEDWTLQHNHYGEYAKGNPVDMAKETYERAIK